MNKKIADLFWCLTCFIPIEVKSGRTSSLKSLDEFVGERLLKNPIRFDLNTTSIEEVNGFPIVSGGDAVSVKYHLHNLGIYGFDYVYAYVRKRFS